MPKNNVGQMKMFETIAVLIVFFFFIAFGLIFYGMIKSKTMQSEHESRLESNAIELAQKVSFLSELDCSQTGIQKENCFDRYKIKAFSNLLNQSAEYYFFIFGFSKIKINQIFPQQEEYIIYDRPKSSFSSAIMTPIPIVVYDEIASKLGRYYFGVMEVTIYD